MQRAREEYPTPDLPPHAPIENGLWIHDQHQKFNGAAQGNPSAKHAAIFDLVYRLLEAGGERRLVIKFLFQLNHVNDEYISRF